MGGRRPLGFFGLAVLTAALAGGCLDLGGLGGEDEPVIVDGGSSSGGGPGGGGAMTGGGGAPSMPRADAGAVGTPADPGLVLRRGRLIDGFEGSDWQCNGTLCLRGRITP
jgi:hypothetical protein